MCAEQSRDSGPSEQEKAQKVEQQQRETQRSFEQMAQRQQERQAERQANTQQKGDKNDKTEKEKGKEERADKKENSTPVGSDLTSFVSNKSADLTNNIAMLQKGGNDDNVDQGNIADSNALQNPSRSDLQQNTYDQTEQRQERQQNSPNFALFFKLGFNNIPDITNNESSSLKRLSDGKDQKDTIYERSSSLRSALEKRGIQSTALTGDVEQQNSDAIANSETKREKEAEASQVTTEVKPDVQDADNSDFVQIENEQGNVDIAKNPSRRPLSMPDERNDPNNLLKGEFSITSSTLDQRNQEGQGEKKEESNDTESLKIDMLPYGAPLTRIEQLLRNTEREPSVIDTSNYETDLVNDIFQQLRTLNSVYFKGTDGFYALLANKSDASANKIVKDTVGDFLKGELVGKIAIKLGAPELAFFYELHQKLEDGIDDYSKALESADLTQFKIGQNYESSRFEIWLTKIQPAFRQEVENITLRAKTANDEQIESNRGKFLIPDNSYIQQYGQMAADLNEIKEDLESRLDPRTPENVMFELSEAWINRSANGSVVIKINPDYTIRSAEINAPQGQKIAEQLIRDHPKGVDIYKMKVPRTVVYFSDNTNSSYAGVISLDKDGNMVNNLKRTSFGIGYEEVFDKIRKNGLPATKKLSGD